MKIYWAFTLIVFALIAGIFSGRTIGAQEDDFPFHAGEKLVFEARWGVVPAGEAVIEVLDPEEINGIRCRHFAISLKTYPFVDLFYKVRGIINSYTDMQMTHSILYKEHKRGKRKKDVVINMDWGKNEAVYSKNGKKRKPVPILPGSFDPLSVFYAFRIHELKEGLEINIPVTDGKKCVNGIARVIKREKIKVNGKVWDTYLVEPDLEHIKGVFEKSKNAKLQLWVTADKYQMLVRVKSKVIIGSFVGDLILSKGIGEKKGGKI